MSINLKKEHQTQHEKEVSAWWNSELTKKWQGSTYEKDHSAHQHYLVRQEKTLELLKSLNLPRNSKILELGFGGAQTAKKILDMGFLYYGIDISEHLCDYAKIFCKNYVDQNKAVFKAASLENNYNFDNEFFDAVVVCGALQYAGNLTNCFTEVTRVLKKNGSFIITQGNMYTLNDLIEPRYFLLSLIRLVTKENFHYSYSLSFRSMLLETKLGKFFSKFENNQFMNNNFMKKGENTWKFKIHKRLFSYSKMKKIILENEFEIKAVKGGPFLFNSEDKTGYIKKNLNNIFQKLLDHKIFTPLIRVADNIIILAKSKK